MYKLIRKNLNVLLLICVVFISFNTNCSALNEKKHRPASNLSVINYAKNLSLSIVDNNFRGSWVIDPNKEEKDVKILKTYNSLVQVKIGSSQKDVRKVLGSPQEVKNNGRIWVFGNPAENGTYTGLTQVFFDEKLGHVIGITSFNPKNIVESIGVTIGDPIDKIISAYGEVVDEKDFFEDPDNKEYLGLYYLYPRSGVGFLVGQEKGTKNLLVQGILVFGTN